jgi:hypothetical protein
MARLSHPPRLDYSTYNWRKSTNHEAHYAIFFHSPVTSSLFGPNILLSTLFSNTLSLCSSLNVRDQVSHQYRTNTYLLPQLYILRLLCSSHALKMYCSAQLVRLLFIHRCSFFWFTGISHFSFTTYLTENVFSILTPKFITKTSHQSKISNSWTA